jgi:hypothetical protein
MTLAVYRGLAVVLLALGAALPADAQDERKAEVSLGYQMLTLKDEDDSETLGLGWYADLAGNIGPLFAVVVQVGGSYKSIENSATFNGFTGTVTADIKMHQFLGGVRLGPRGTAIEPYVELLAGAVNGSVDVSNSVVGGGQTIISQGSSDSSTDAAVQVGGGVTIWLSRSIGLRGALAYMRVIGEDEGTNVVRAAGGLTFGF